jgi:Tfp pilus assembly protein PilE
MKNIQLGNAMIERMSMVTIIGILAAVAIPAYGDYTVHAKAAAASNQSGDLTIPLTPLYMTSGVI